MSRRRLLGAHRVHRCTSRVHYAHRVRSRYLHSGHGEDCLALERLHGKPRPAAITIVVGGRSAVGATHRRCVVLMFWASARPPTPPCHVAYGSLHCAALDAAGTTDRRSAERSIMSSAVITTGRTLRPGAEDGHCQWSIRSSGVSIRSQPGHTRAMSVLSVALPVAGTLLVALLGYLQWRRTERHKVRIDTANFQSVDQERARTAANLYRQQRIRALQELVSTLKSLELESRWNSGGHDLRGEIPHLNSFLIRHGAVLDGEDCRLARDFLDGLTWIDHYIEGETANWEKTRGEILERTGHDIGSYNENSEWCLTGPGPPQEVIAEIQASVALESRLRDALQGR